MNLRANDGVVTVAELTAVIRSLLEDGIGHVDVVGEISNFKQHTSGHRYFTLKDADAAIACVMWRTRQLGFVPEDGMRVQARGRITVYPPRGNYQIDVTSLKPEGVGDLHAAFEALKEKLAAAGWFDHQRKRALPRFPKRIGVATAATGAAVQDIFSTLNRRFAPLEVVFRQTIVQGDGSADDVAQAIADLNAANVELIIVGRGGGSIEDLWSFNTETVARAILESTVPVISAVGHETDTTIADFVADKRAETPTAAAELATPVTSADLMLRIDDVTSELTEAVLSRVSELKEIAEAFTDGSALRRVQERLQRTIVRLGDVRQAMHSSILHRIELYQQQCKHLKSQLLVQHPYRPLKLGYAIVEANGSPVAASDKLAANAQVTLIRAQQKHQATITATENREDSPNA